MLINCDSKIIGKEIINECCEAFKNEQNEIIVSINLEPEKLDLSLIGYFISFKLTRPIIALCIKLNFDYNKSNNKDFNSFYFTLHQYRCHADMICGFNVFSIISLNNEPIKSTFENIVVSKSFLPIIPVNRNLYTRFFEEKLVNEAFEGELEFSSVSNYFNNIIKKPSIEKYELYISKIHSNEKNSTELKFNFDQSFDDLIHLHLLELLNNLFILENLNKPKLNRISILDKIKSKEYFTSICQLFLKEVLKHPKIYVLIFSLLIDKVHIAGIKNDNLEETLHKIKNLWNFCRSVLHGVNELVKNIIEHTEEGIGCLVFRFYSDKIWDEIIDLPIKNMPDFNQYRASIKTDINSFLQIDILDLGQLGIIPKLKKNIENKLLNFFSNKNLLKLLNNDLEILNQGYSLKDIIYPNIGPRKILLHQSKRSIAHFGLIIFGKLIQKNNGLFFVSSAKSLDERENYLYIGKNDINKSVFENNQNDNIVSNLLKEHSVKYGTNYKIVFPIITQKPKTSPHYTYSLERSTSLKSLKGIAQLLQFKNLRSSRNFEGIPIKNYLPVNFKTEKYLHKLLNIIIFEIEHSKEMPNIVM
ncbi:MAG: hypothetical protein IPN97_06855 [Saprospiraceae bacterium]|nr:hypothetical protein [Saprospiraceae bacterium]